MGTRGSGFIAITTVLILSAVALAIGTTIAKLSIGEGQSGLATYYGEKELILAESCMEQALYLVRASMSYTGGTVTLPSGACDVTTSKVGNVWTVNSTTNSTAYKRGVQVVARRTGTGLVLTSWREI